MAIVKVGPQIRMKLLAREFPGSHETDLAAHHRVGDSVRNIESIHGSKFFQKPVTEASLIAANSRSAPVLGRSQRQISSPPKHFPPARTCQRCCARDGRTPCAKISASKASFFHFQRTRRVGQWLSSIVPLEKRGKLSGFRRRILSRAAAQIVRATPRQMSSFCAPR
jgi:hypothetical protein